MKTLIRSFICFLLLIVCVCLPSIGQVAEEGNAKIDTKERVLIVQHRTNGKQFIFTQGMLVRYWTQGSELPTVGVIYEFEKGAIVINGIRIPLNQLVAIKIKDRDALNAFKVLGPILGIGGAIAGFKVGSTLFSGQGAFKAPYIVGVVGLVTGFIPLVKSSMKYHMRRYHFQIIDTEPGQLKYNDKGHLEYISSVHP